ncbi:MAG: ABC transporter ATP-binding protein [Candidatus Zixiibacteriota bacterium]|nr:MAG: ABC transporter ATP-binding protein [candidate division Zixibacteria bacterium]
MSAIKAENLTRRFGKFTAVDAISFEVEQGEVFGFLGANGAGKTTAIRMLTGLLMPSGGDAWVAGRSVRANPRAIKQVIGYMSQRFSLYEELRVEENLDFFAGAYNLDRETSRRRKEEILEQFGLEGVRRRFTRSLPLGWKQRLALGSALLHHPRILFLDEPTGGVDPLARRTFWDTIHDLAAGGATVFVTTHYMDEAEYCHRISIMNKGEIVALGSPLELKRQYGKDTIQEVFVQLIKSTG